MNQPLVSVYIPTKNRPQLLQRALLSCLSQDYGAIEILLVDDGSDEAAAAQIAAMAATDQRIRLFRLSPSAGAPQARNLAIAEARGEFITGLDDDDEFLAGRIRNFVCAAQQNPQIGFFCSGYQYALASGQTLRGLTGSLQFGLQELLMKNLVGNQIFCRTAVLRQVGGFDPDLPACQDYDLWIRLCAAGLAGQRLDLQNYLVHQAHELPRISTQQRRLQGQLMLAEKHRALMTPMQYRAQHFYAQLYAGPVTLGQIIRDCPLPLWPLALKMTVLRWLGRKV